MKTSKKQTSPLGVERSMSLLADFPASLSALPDSARERQITVTSGRKCFAQYERYDPLGSLVKTLLESFQWYSPVMKLQWKVKPLYGKRLTRKRYSNRNTLSKPSAKILSKKDIPSSRLLFRLAPSARHTGGTGFGLLPTPTAMMPGDQDMKKLDARRQVVRSRKGYGNGFGVTLNEMAKKGLLPTPTNSMVTYQDFIQAGYHSSKRPEYRLIPTPNARDADKYSKKYNPKSQSGSALPALAVNGLLPTPIGSNWKPPCDPGTGSLNLQTRISKICGETSQLNPLFVEEMMGFPSMWCALPFLSAGGAQDRLKDTETP